MEHRIDIEGLRGLAVIAVVLFHAGYDFASGGYIGVDIFFVLSGFLISGSIQQSILSGKFSLLNFYRRRVLRIFPAAIVVILIVGLVGRHTLFPEELKELSESVYFFLILSSNVWAADSISYFGIGVDYKPLIHYWSLSIELQFYILFPVLLSFFLIRKKQRILGVICCILFFSSLIYAVKYIELSPNEGYFSTTMRLWEFALGVLIFLYIPNYRRYIKPHRFKNFLTALGISIVIVSVILFDENSNVPGLKALFPCLGVALILIFPDKDSIFTKLLSSFSLRFAGAISFSLYLVHQPVLAYYRTFVGRDLNSYEPPLLILLSVLFACILYFLIEKPFHRNSGIINKTSSLALFSGFLISLVYSAQGMAEKLPQFKLSHQVEELLKYRYDNNPRLKECRVSYRIDPNKTCLYGPPDLPKIAIWGDSHVDQIVMPLAKESVKRGYSILEFAITGCPPMLDFEPKTSGKKCSENSSLVLEYLKKSNEIKHVFLHAYWIAYFDEHIRYPALSVEKAYNSVFLIDSLGVVVRELIKSGKKVHIIYPVPKMKVNPPLYAARKKLFSPDSEIPVITLTESEYRAQSAVSISILDTVVEQFDINAIYISDYLYDRKLSVYNAIDKSSILYRDDNHLSYTGASKIAGDIIKDALGE